MLFDPFPFIVFVFRVVRRRISLHRSREWTKVAATVLGVHLSDGFFYSVTVDYEYGTEVPKYAGTFVKPFLVKSSAKIYSDQLRRGMSFAIRMQPDHPEMSVAAPSEDDG
jgi:hypothetical protein